MQAALQRGLAQASKALPQSLLLLCGIAGRIVLKAMQLTVNLKPPTSSYPGWAVHILQYHLGARSPTLTVAAAAGAYRLPGSPREYSCPSDAEEHAALYNMACCYAQLGQKAAALTCLESILETGW